MILEEILCGQFLQNGIFPLCHEADVHAGSGGQLSVILCRGNDVAVFCRLIISTPHAGDQSIPRKLDLPVLYGFLAVVDECNFSCDMPAPGGSDLGGDFIPLFLLCSRNRSGMYGLRQRCRDYACQHGTGQKHGNELFHLITISFLHIAPPIR